jgi:hypothetical protein
MVVVVHDLRNMFSRTIFLEGKLIPLKKLYVAFILLLAFKVPV